MGDFNDCHKGLDNDKVATSATSLQQSASCPMTGMRAMAHIALPCAGIQYQYLDLMLAIIPGFTTGDYEACMSDIEDSI